MFSYFIIVSYHGDQNMIKFPAESRVNSKTPVGAGTKIVNYHTKAPPLVFVNGFRLLGTFIAIFAVDEIRHATPPEV